MHSNARQLARQRAAEIEEKTKSLRRELEELSIEEGHLAYFFDHIVPNIANGSGPRVTIVEGAINVLEQEGKCMETAKITTSIMSLDGFESASKNPINSINATLHGESKKDNPRIIRVGRLYGLPHFAERETTDEDIPF